MSFLRMPVLAGLGMTLFVASAVAQVPAVDGLFDEWPDDTQIASDPFGDAIGGVRGSSGDAILIFATASLIVRSTIRIFPALPCGSPLNRWQTALPGY